MSVSNYNKSQVENLSKTAKEMQLALYPNVFHYDDVVILNKLENIAKNKKIIEYFPNFLASQSFLVDFKDLNKNFDAYKANQDIRSTIINLLLHSTITSYQDGNYKKFSQFIEELFISSVDNDEKKQIAKIVDKYALSLKQDIQDKLNVFKTISSDNLNILKKKQSVRSNTNNFFFNEIVNKEKERENNRLLKKIKKKINSLIDDITQTYSTNNKRHKENLSKEETKLLQEEGVNLDDLDKILNKCSSNIKEIEELFQITDDDLEEQDYIDSAKLKKAKIFLLNKLLSNVDKIVSKWLIIIKINKILSLEQKDLDQNLLTMLSKECDFEDGSNLHINDNDALDNLTKIEQYDIINTFNQDEADITKENIDVILNNLLQYEEIEFLEIKDDSQYNGKEVYIKEIKQDGDKKCLIAFSSSQKDDIFMSLYQNPEAIKILTKKYNDQNIEKTLKGNCEEIKDFIKILQETSKNPTATTKYEDVYNKFYVQQQLNALGCVKNDKTFSMDAGSSTTFYKNDFSKYAISTKILLNWLKIQALENNPIDEIKVKIIDLENLPTMLDEYYDWFLNQRDVLDNNQLTPATNITIKSQENLSNLQCQQIFNKLNTSDKICFKNLKIDNEDLYNYSLSNGVSNKYLFFGVNDIFDNLNSTEQEDINIFNAKNQKRKTGSLGKEKSRNIAIDEYYDIDLSYEDIVYNLTQKIEKILKEKQNNTNSTEIETSIETETDVDVELLLNFNKPAEQINGIQDNDIVTAQNVERKMKELLKKDNNSRLDPALQTILINFQKSIGLGWKSIFEDLTNRKQMLPEFKNTKYKYSNYAFTVEAFISLIYDRLKFGITKWNGIQGDPSFKTLYFDKKNGERVYVVAKNTDNIEKATKHPVVNMFSALPLQTIEYDNEMLKKKYNHEQIQAGLNEILNLTKDENIKKVFVLNPSKVSIEYANYINNNKDEIKQFINYIEKDQVFKNICSAVCGTLCKEKKLGNLTQNFSLIDPVKLMRGLHSFFNLLWDLKTSGFVCNGNLFYKISSAVSKNPYSLQNLYILLLEQKTKVSRAIIEDLNQKQICNININDHIAVKKYIKTNSDNLLGINKTGYPKDYTIFSEQNFDRLLDGNNFLGNTKFLNESMDTWFLHSSIDSFGTVSYENKPNGEYAIKDYNSSSSFEKIMYLLHKKYNRLENGALNEPSLSPHQIGLISNKIHYTTWLRELLNIIPESNRDEMEGPVLEFASLVLLTYYNNSEITIDIKNFQYQLRYNIENKLSNTKDFIETIKQIKDNPQNLSSIVYCLFNNSNKVVAGEGGKTTSDLLVSMQAELEESNSYKQLDDKKRNKTLSILNKLVIYTCDHPGNDDEDEKNLKNNIFNKIKNDNIFDIKLYNGSEDNTALSTLSSFNNKPDDVILSLKDFLCLDDYIDDKVDTNINDLFLPYLDDNIGDKNKKSVFFACDYDGKYSLLSNNEKGKVDLLTNVTYSNFLLEIFKKLNNNDDRKRIVEEIKQVIQLGYNFSDLYAVLSLFKEEKNGVLNINVDDISTYISNLLTVAEKCNKKPSLYQFYDLYNVLRQTNYKSELNNNVYFDNFLLSPILDLSQKKEILSEYKNKDHVIVNNIAYITSIVDDFQKDNIKQKLIFPELSLKKIIAKYFNDGLLDKEGDFQKSIKGGNIIGKVRALRDFFDIIQNIQRSYDTALINNDINAQNRYIKLIAKISQLLDIDNMLSICELLHYDIGEDNLKNDPEILDVIEYAIIHNCKKYQEIKKVFQQSKNNHFLNNAYTHEQILEMLEYKDQSNKEKEEILSCIDGVESNILSKIKNEIPQGTKVENKIKKTLNKVKSSFSNLVNSFYSNDTNNEKILKKINKEYTDTSILTPENIEINMLNVELLNLLEEGNITANVQDDKINNLKRAIEYVKTLTQIFLSDQKLANKRYQELNNKKELTQKEEIEMLACYNTKQVLELNKSLTAEQISAIVLQNYLIEQQNKNNKVFIKMPTGAGKTLTILGKMEQARRKNKISFAITSNHLLVQEMIAEAEKLSTFKNHIYYINEKQQLINKQTNEVVPEHQIPQILKDKRNNIFSTYSNLDFWQKKLLLNKGSIGIEILNILKERGQLCVDEADLLIDTDKTNKISTTSRQLFDEKDILFLERIQQAIKDGETCKKTANEVILDASKYVPENTTIKEEERIHQLNLLKAMMTANIYKQNVDYTVETDEEGYSVIYPMKDCVPDKSGAKYDQNVLFVLKWKLMQQGKMFKDLFSSSSLIGESSNFQLLNSFNDVFCCSGTISGADDIWVKNNFDIVNLQPTYQKLLKENKYASFIDWGDIGSAKQDIILLAEALSCTEGQVSVDDLKNLQPNDDDSHTYGDIIGNNNNFWKDVQSLMDKNNNDKDKQYRLAIYNDSENLKKRKETLQQNLINLGLDNKVEILSLDKRTAIRSYDDVGIKETLQQRNNVFVFALSDRARGFDFPGSPRYIATEIDSLELTEQKLGRTARNKRAGSVTYAYYTGNQKIDNTKDVEKKLEKIKQLQKEKTRQKVERDKSKIAYYNLTNWVSNATFYFLNLITQNTDDKTKSEVFSDVSVLIDSFNQKIKQNYELNQTNDVDELNYFVKKKDIRKLLKNCSNYADAEINVEDAINKAIQFANDRTSQENINNKPKFNPKKISQQTRIDKKSSANLGVLLDNQQYVLSDNINNSKNDKDKLKDKIIFSSIGSVVNCGFELKTYNSNEEDRCVPSIALSDSSPTTEEPYSYAELDSDVIIAKKQILKNDAGKMIIQDRDIAIINNENDNTKLMLKTLSPKSLIIKQLVNEGDGEESPSISVQLLDDYNANDDGKLYSAFKNFFYKENDIQDNINLQTLFIDYVIKFYSETGNIPTIDDLGNLYNLDYAQKLERLKQINELEKKQQSDSNQSTDNKEETNFEQYEIKLREGCLIRIGLEHLDKLGALKIKDTSKENEEQEEEQNSDTITEDTMKAKAKEYSDKINQLKKFNLELEDEELEQVKKNIDQLSDILVNKIRLVNDKISNLTEIITQDDCIKYTDKQSLLQEINSILSKKNLQKETERIMNIVSTPARYEAISYAGEPLKCLDNLDLFQNVEETKNDEVWKNQVNLDNIEAFEKNLKIKEESKEKVDHVSNKMKNQCDPTEKNLKDSISDGHNNITENFNYLDKFVDKVKSHKAILDNLQKNDIKFTKFDNDLEDDEISNLNEKLKDIKEKYQTYVENVKKDNYITDKQKLDFIDNGIDKHLDKVITSILNKDNLPKIFNNFSLKNYSLDDNEDDTLFNTDATEEEKILLNKIKEAYLQEFSRETYASIDGSLEVKEKVNNVDDGEEESTEENTEKNEDEEPEKEDTQKTPYQKFKERVKQLLYNYQDVIQQNKNIQNDTKEELPVNAYNFFEKVLSGLNQNYLSNKQKHDELVGDISKSIKAVSNVLKGVKNVHKTFKKELLDNLNQNAPDIAHQITNVDDILSDANISNLTENLSTLDVDKLKAIKETLRSSINKDYNETRQQIAENNDVSLGFKIFLVCITFGLILLTKKGEKMFEDKFVADKEIAKKDYKINNYLVDNEKQTDINKQLQENGVVLEDIKNQKLFNQQTKTIKNKMNINLKNTQEIIQQK